MTAEEAAGTSGPAGHGGAPQQAEPGHQLEPAHPLEPATPLEPPPTATAPLVAWDPPAGDRALRTAPDDAGLLRRTRLRLVAWSGGITLAVLLLLGATLFAAVRTSLESDSVAQLRQRADVIGRVVGRLPAGTDGSSPELRPGFGGPNAATVALVVRPDGGVIASAQATELGLPDAAGIAAARGGSIDIRSISLGDVPVRVLSEPVDRDGATYVVQVVGDRTAEVRTLGSLVGVLAIGGLLALAFAIGGGWIYAERALVPIRESIRRQRAFAADASHELRTPLAVIRGNLEYLSRHPEARVGDLAPAVDDMTAEIDELTRLVDDLLLLARADSGAIEVAREQVDLADVATAAIGALAPLAETRSVRLNLDAQPAMVLGDAGRLRQVVTILIDNAIRHSPAGGSVFLGVAPVGRDALLRVDDEGPGIREEDRPHLFERFWRAADAPSGGAGLGLSIAAWIVSRHAGTIEGRSRPDGRGARFEVRIPLTT
ncbi:MAG TPA: HAMP domain-containing sensor histidine kinase [Candidatus Dormibacteraeota bacterium]|nr:HAMP domain-containing sensor histidine kinase [Candidatus Dormibacteraeota bacterium]